MVSHLLNTAFKQIALKISFNIFCPQQHALLFVCHQWHKTEPNKLQNPRALCLLFICFLGLIYFPDLFLSFAALSPLHFLSSNI